VKKEEKDLMRITKTTTFAPRSKKRGERKEKEKEKEDKIRWCESKVTTVNNTIEEIGKR